MDWSHVDYCDVFISCLDSHSDGTHSLQSKWCNVTSLQIWWRNKLIYILDLVNLQQMFIFGSTISLTKMNTTHNQSDIAVPLNKCIFDQPPACHRCRLYSRQKTPWKGQTCRSRSSPWVQTEAVLVHTEEEKHKWMRATHTHTQSVSHRRSSPADCVRSIVHVFSLLNRMENTCEVSNLTPLSDYLHACTKLTMQHYFTLTFRI